MLPEFDQKGYLPGGLHTASGIEFLERFLFNDYRKGFTKSVSDIFDWSKSKHASVIFVGGSFVSNNEKPHDLDCLIVFPHEDAIPHKSELLTIEATKIDIQFCAESDSQLVDSFLHLLTHTREHAHIGVVQIELYGKANAWQILHEPDDPQMEIIKRAYIGRHYVDHYEPNGVLATIHGVRSKANWNAEIAPIASSQNWVFAPFVYEDEDAVGLLTDRKKSKAIIEAFRDWVYDLGCRYPYNISIIAHSFGTYILASYISGFDKFLPIRLNAVVLTGSIINPEFNWESHKGVRVAQVLNEVAPNDQWVKHIPKLKWITANPLYGNSGVVGFSKECEILVQESNDIFDHNNVIKRDVIERHWMPFLMTNRDAYSIQSNAYIFKTSKS